MFGLHLSGLKRATKDLCEAVILLREKVPESEGKYQGNELPECVGRL